jgi:hypothetical protein
MDEEHARFRSLFVLLGQAVSERTNYMLSRANYLNDAGLALFQLSEERMHETAALQRRQNVLLEMLMELVRRGLPTAEGEDMPAAFQAWNDIIAKEEAAMNEAHAARRDILSRLRMQEHRFRNLSSEAMNAPDNRLAERLTVTIGEARRLLRPEGASEDLTTPASVDSDVRRGAEILGIKQEAAKALGLEDGEDDAEDGEDDAEDDQDDQDDVPATSAMDLSHDAPPARVVLDLTSETPERVPASRSPHTNAPEPMDVDVAVFKPPAGQLESPSGPARPLPIVNIISATPQQSQETPATMLLPPTAVAPPSSRRNRSRTPVITSPPVTRARARSRTPAIDITSAPMPTHPALLQPESTRPSRSISPVTDSSGGVKRKSAGEDDPEARKKAKK